MIGAYTALPSWSSALSELAFTDQALKAGRAKAIAVWNSTPTEIASQSLPGAYEPVISASDYGANSMVEYAAYAYAIMTECLRDDGIRAPTQAGGLVAEPSPNLVGSLPAAMSVAREYAKWAAQAKNRIIVKSLGV